METCCHSDFSETPSANADVKISNEWIIIIIIIIIIILINQTHNKRMQLISTEGVQGETRQGRQGDPLGNV